MTNLTIVSLAAATLIGASMPASAAPRLDEGRPALMLVSGGWATRAEGKRSTYDDAYDYGYGYGYLRGYDEPGYAYGPYGDPYAVDDEGGYDAY